mgnify:CR=1 FL=1
MTVPAKVKREVISLREQIKLHNRLYHSLDAPEIPDADYDALLIRLEELEQEYDLVTSDSPTQRVGGAPLSQFTQVTHEIPMLSLAKVFSEKDLRDFETRIKKRLGSEEKLVYSCEPKVDGIAVSLLYIDGLLTRAATRGDGVIGEDITHNVKTIRSIPLEISVEPFKKIEVRGEVYMPKKEFQRLNAMREEAGESPFANPRNAAAGALRVLDPAITDSRKLGIFIYTVGFQDRDVCKTHSELQEQLKALRFPVNEHNRLCANFEETIAVIEEWRTKKNDLNYEVDGLVIQINSLAYISFYYEN